MNKAAIASVQIVGDGLFVQFADGLASFFPASFLELQRNFSPNQIFVSESALDASPESFGRSPLWHEATSQPGFAA